MGLMKPIVVTLVGSAAFIGLLLGNPDYSLFLIAVCGFNFLWNLGLPFIFSGVGDMDRKGTMITYAIAVQMTGLGFGPFLAAAILGQDGTFRDVELLSVSLYLLCAIPLFIGLIAHRRALNATRAAAE